MDPVVDLAAEIPDDTDSLADELNRLQEYDAYRQTSQEEISRLKLQVSALENALEQSKLLRTDQKSSSSWDRLVNMMRLKDSQQQLWSSQVADRTDHPANPSPMTHQTTLRLFLFRNAKNITSTEQWILLGLVNLSLVSVLSLMMFAHHLHSR